MTSLFNNQSPEFFAEGILAGNIAILSRAITLVESSNPERRRMAEQILEKIYPKTGKSFRLGVTGVPGVGKSTFIESFGQTVLKKGHKLAVLAVDPSSNISKGSILGDKTRMEKLSVSRDVFIRPSPSSGTLGGLARATFETMLLCEAAGYDFIIIETVGVGQSEVAVKKITDFFLLLMLAGAGDELQGIKRGIMEMADSMAITKADGNNLIKAKAAKAEYQRAMHLLQPHESGFVAEVHICSGLENTGMDDIYDVIDRYKRKTELSGYLTARRKEQQKELLLDLVEENLKLKFYSNESVKKTLSEINTSGSILPFSLASKIVDDFLKNS